MKTQPEQHKQKTSQVSRSLMKEVVSTMGLLRIGFYKSPAIIPHNPEHDARFVSNNGFWYLSLVRRSCA
jgi:hypothetical protein